MIYYILNKLQFTKNTHKSLCKWKESRIFNVTSATALHKKMKREKEKEKERCMNRKAVYCKWINQQMKMERKRKLIDNRAGGCS